MAVSRILFRMGCAASLARKPQAHPAVAFVATPASSLRGRLVSLGETFSVEVSPGDVFAPSGDGGKTQGTKLLSLMEEAKAAGRAPLLQSGNPVYVNMVKPTMAHFDDVAGATKVLTGIGLAAVPHLPASRFEAAADLRGTLRSLQAAGAKELLVVGGNDLLERSAAGLCAFPGGVQALLHAEVDSLRANGMERVVLAGHPDGHPGLGWDEAATDALLLEKVSHVLRSGLDVAIATQFSFDARKLVRWLQRTRQKISQLTVQPGEGRPTQPQAVFHIGIPGPTSKKKLERIAKICEVPSLFIGSAFDAIDTDGDGMVSLEDLQRCIEKLGLARKGSKLHSMYVRHAGADGLLRPDEFAQLLVEDAGISRQPSKLEAPGDASPAKVALGPSASVSGATVQGDGPHIVWPEELVLALAGYCDREKVAPGEVVLHLFPFGGLPLTFELTRKLRDGTWPPLTAESTR